VETISAKTEKQTPVPSVTQGTMTTLHAQKSVLLAPVHLTVLMEGAIVGMVSVKGKNPYQNIRAKSLHALVIQATVQQTVESLGTAPVVMGCVTAMRQCTVQHMTPAMDQIHLQ
jgi:hypothetical protein